MNVRTLFVILALCSSFFARAEDPDLRFGRPDVRLPDGIVQLERVGLCTFPSLGSLCATGATVCGLRYGKNHMAENALCRATDATVIQKRNGDVDLAQTIGEFARTRMDAIRSNQEIQKTCCDGTSDPKACGTFLSRVQLEIVAPEDEAKTGESACHYHPLEKTPKITCAQSYLNQAMDPAVVDSALLHEFGHACHEARGKKGMLFKDCHDAEAIAQVKGEVKKLFGEKYLNCVGESFAAQKVAWEASGTAVCVASWWREVLADTVFYRWRDRPEAWSWLCWTGGAYHAAPLAYGHCVAQIPGFDEFSCGVKIQ